MPAILDKRTHTVNSNNPILTLNLNTLPTQGILHAEFRSIWTTFRPDEIDLFSKFVIRKIRNFPYEKLTFFLGKLYQKFLSF